MKKKKEFVVPGVLQVCEVMLEANLLAGSNEVMAPPSAIETTGQQVTRDSDTHDWTMVGSDFD